MARKIKPRYDLVYLKWIDSSSNRNQSWHQIEDHDFGLVYIETVGFLINDSDVSVTVSPTISMHDGMIGDITIPKVALTERVLIAKGIQ